MPAAFYEFNVEQGSNFVTSLKVMNPAGGLFKFLPKTTETAWGNNNTTLNFDVPEEIKLAYPNNSNSFGWMKTATSGEFLRIRAKVKDSKGIEVLGGSSVYSVGSDKKITKTPGAGAILFDIIQNPTDYNIILQSSGQFNQNGKYFYDIELEYKLGSTANTTSFVIRLLQGKMVFNPNITT
jgi:hypothetical protein